MVIVEVIEMLLQITFQKHFNELIQGVCALRNGILHMLLCMTHLLEFLCVDLHNQFDNIINQC